jgi:hypothetical protein
MRVKDDGMGKMGEHEASKTNPALNITAIATPLLAQNQIDADKTQIEEQKIEVTTMREQDVKIGEIVVRKANTTIPALNEPAITKLLFAQSL